VAQLDNRRQQPKAAQNSSHTLVGLWIFSLQDWNFSRRIVTLAETTTTFVRQQ
jgi:hypothetical protein